MNLIELAEHHGYITTAGLLFLASCGLPLPLSVVLLTAGAAAHGGGMSLGLLILFAWLAALSGDTLMYLGGRYTGWWLLAGICRLSVNPEQCIFGSAKSFYERGPKTLLVAKFVPGLGTVAAPLAGSLNMKLSRFLRLDSLGVLMYVCAYTVTGFVFAKFIHEILNWVASVGHVTAATMLLVVIAYGMWLVYNWLRDRRYNYVERVAAEELVDTDARGDARQAGGDCGCAVAWVLRSGDDADKELDPRGAEPAEGRINCAARVYGAGV